MLSMDWSDIIWMVFVVVLTFIILYQQREIRKLRSASSSRCNGSPDKNSKPDNTTNKPSD